MWYRVVCEQLQTADGKLYSQGAIVSLDDGEAQTCLRIRAVVVSEQPDPSVQTVATVQPTPDPAATDKAQLDVIKQQEHELEAKIAGESGE